MYARKAGIMGKIQGAINELRPASNATSIVGSAIKQIHVIFPLKHSSTSLPNLDAINF